MVERTFCDRCDVEIEDSPFDDFEKIFDSTASEFLNKEPKILEPHLCRKCNKGYEKIIKVTNKEIERYLEEK